VQGAWSTRQEIDGGLEFGADAGQVGGIGDFVAELVLHVKRVDGRAFFRGDLGEADVEAQLAERVRDRVEQAERSSVWLSTIGPASC
jgi:hypothetical protein